MFHLDCQQPWGASTQLIVTNILSRGTFRARDSSLLHVLNAEVEKVYATDEATVVMQGSRLPRVTLPMQLEGSASLVIYDSVLPHVVLRQAASLQLLRGTIEDNLFFDDDALGVLSGGRVRGRVLLGQRSSLEVEGGLLHRLGVGDDAVVVIRGTSFTVDGLPVANGASLLNEQELTGLLRATGCEFHD